MKMKKIINSIPSYILLIIFSLMALFPILVILNTSLRTRADIIQKGPFAPPTVFHFENYVQAWQLGHFLIYYKNSLIITSATIIGVLAFSLLAAYAFSFLKFKGRSFWYAMIIFGLIIPVELIIIPTFYNMIFLHLAKTHWVLILPQIGATVPFGIFLLRSFMSNLPHELLESARIDGASEFRILFHVVTPLVKPALITLLIFTAMWSWNNFFAPVVLIQREYMRTVPLGLLWFQSTRTTEFPLITAGAMIVAIPIIIIYLIFQRSLIRGITAGALKE